MLLIWGHKFQLTPLGEVQVPCPQCGKAPMVLNRAVKRFTIYWIPTFSMGRSHCLTCPRCKNRLIHPIKDELALKLKDQAAPVAG